MNIPIFLGEKLATYLGLPKAKKDIFIYGLDVMLTSITGYVLIIGISCLLNIAYLVIPMLLTHSILRSFSGGAHGSKLRYCLSISMIAFNGFGLILRELLKSPILNLQVMIVFDILVLIIGLYIISKKAPLDVKAKPITSKKQREKLKRYSLAVLLIWYGLVLIFTLLTGIRYKHFIFATSIGMLWQVFTLTEWGKVLFHWYGKGLTKIGI